MNTFRHAHTVLSKLMMSLQNPGITHFARTLKRPNNPKVVILGNSPRVTELVSREFAAFGQVNGANTSALSEAEQANAVAKEILTIQNNFDDGYFLVDFPRNAAQASRLDLLTEGVNLALYLRDPTDNVTATQQKELIEYYRKTGALVEVEVDPKADIEEQAAALSTTVTNGYKL